MQRIFPENLSTHLNKGLLPIYFLTGQDPLLVDEAKETLIDVASQHEFEEKIEVSVANDTNWDDLFEHVQSMGLFFNRKIIVLNLPEKINVNYQRKLQQLISLLHSDILVIFHFPKFTRAIENQKWINQINQPFLIVQCQTPERDKLSNWLTYRAKVMELQLDRDVISLLCYSYEGNLLALKQSLQLLQLYFPKQKIKVSQVKEIIEQSSQFTPFQWVDALLEGKIARALRILTFLKNEDTQPIVLLRIIQKELTVLLDISCANLQKINAMQPLQNVNLRREFDRLNVWQNKRNIYQYAINRFTYRQLFLFFQFLAELERKIKQEFSDEIWIELERFSLKFK